MKNSIRVIAAVLILTFCTISVAYTDASTPKSENEAVYDIEGVSAQEQCNVQAMFSENLPFRLTEEQIKAYKADGTWDILVSFIDSGGAPVTIKSHTGEDIEVVVTFSEFGFGISPANSPAPYVNISALSPQPETRKTTEAYPAILRSTYIIRVKFN